MDLEIRLQIEIGEIELLIEVHVVTRRMEKMMTEEEQRIDSLEITEKDLKTKMMVNTTGKESKPRMARLSIVMRFPSQKEEIDQRVMMMERDFLMILVDALEMYLLEGRCSTEAGAGAVRDQTTFRKK